MRKIAGKVIKFIREDGPTAVECAVMLALITIVCITALAATRPYANTTFSEQDEVVKSTAS